MSTYKSDDPIDFVVIWVDGNDQDWQKNKDNYLALEKGTVDGSSKRYRDFGLLKYLFRGFEEFAPWVNKVYLVTNGQIPSWVNLDAEKLVWIKHEDYIANEFLPVFSANPIELPLHRIEGLSEKFVFFNDDFYLISPVDKTQFFSDNLPVLNPQASLTIPKCGYDQFSHLMLNNVMLINKNFNARKVISKNLLNWLSPFRVGLKSSLYNIIPMTLGYFTGFSNPHMPSPFLKSVFKEVWSKEYATINQTMKHRFRSNDDVTQYLFYDWQLATNRFVPAKRSRLGKYFEITNNPNNNDELFDSIKQQKYPVICINDSVDEKKVSDEYISSVEESLIRAFETILPNKSSFEI